MNSPMIRNRILEILVLPIEFEKNSSVKIRNLTKILSVVKIQSLTEALSRQR